MYMHIGHIRVISEAPEDAFNRSTIKYCKIFFLQLTWWLHPRYMNQICSLQINFFPPRLLTHVSSTDDALLRNSKWRILVSAWEKKEDWTQEDGREGGQKPAPSQLTAASTNERALRATQLGDPLPKKTPAHQQWPTLRPVDRANFDRHANGQNLSAKNPFQSNF